MGWQIVGRLPVALSVRRPLRMLINRAIGRAAGDDPYSPASKRTELWTGWEGLRPGTNGSWRTADRPGYLQWRYGDCPVASYLVTGEPGKFLVVVHPKATAFGTEFRVVEERIAAGQEPAAKLALAALVRKHRPVLVSAASTTALSGFSWFRRPLGPVLTYRELNHSAPLTLDQWAYSLGDMELF